ncbi:MAG: hypothetical protein JWP78_3336 [Mucilaginibacter sp.]|nr:hypothetical protein [Mucilaginibacter sp.]
MAYLRKKLERRTYSQDRYYILIKRQKSGKATFNELTELDEIVNRVPDIREKVIRESFFTDNTQDINTPPNDPGGNDKLHEQPVQHQPFWNRIKSLITRLFISQISVVKSGDLSPLF